MFTLKPIGNINIVYNLPVVDMAYDQAAMDRALAVVDDSSEQELSILRIAEPLLTLSQREHDNTEKSAGAATHNTDAPTPASLNADLEHYKVIQSKVQCSREY